MAQALQLDWYDDIYNSALRLDSATLVIRKKYLVVTHEEDPTVATRYELRYLCSYSMLGNATRYFVHETPGNPPLYIKFDDDEDKLAVFEITTPPIDAQGQPLVIPVGAIPADVNVVTVNDIYEGQAHIDAYNQAAPQNGGKRRKTIRRRKGRRSTRRNRSRRH